MDTIILTIAREKILKIPNITKTNNLLIKILYKRKFTYEYQRINLTYKHKNN
jgi:hypothetical protein